MPILFTTAKLWKHLQIFFSFSVCLILSSTATISDCRTNAIYNNLRLSDVSLYGSAPAAVIASLHLIFCLILQFLGCRCYCTLFVHLLSVLRMMQYAQLNFFIWRFITISSTFADALAHVVCFISLHVTLNASSSSFVHFFFSLIL